MEGHNFIKPRASDFRSRVILIFWTLPPTLKPILLIISRLNMRTEIASLNHVLFNKLKIR